MGPKVRKIGAIGSAREDNLTQASHCAAAAAAFSGREAAAGRLSGSEKRHFLQAKKRRISLFFLTWKRKRHSTANLKSTSMKKLLFPVLALMLCIPPLSAQNKGDKYVGGIIGITTTSISIDGSSASQTTFGFAPEFGYFASDRLRVGGSIGYQLISSDGETTHGLTAGPSLAYYVRLCDRSTTRRSWPWDSRSHRRTGPADTASMQDCRSERSKSGRRPISDSQSAF